MKAYILNEANAITPLFLLHAEQRVVAAFWQAGLDPTEAWTPVYGKSLLHSIHRWPYV